MKVKAGLYVLQIYSAVLQTGHIIANTSPFMFGHSLIVPEPDRLFNQVLRKDSLELVVRTMLASTDE